MDDSPQDIEGVVARIRDGDRTAFGALVKRHRARVETVIRLRVGRALRRRVDVEDALQETYLRAFKGMRDFEWRGERQFLSWLLSVTESVCTDLVRRHVLSQKNQLDREVSLDSLRDASDSQRAAALPPGSWTGPSRGLRREERLARLEAALDTLSTRHREVVILSVLQRLPTQEVARRLELTPAAVCMLRTRALRKLREVFGDTDSFRLPEARRGSDEG